LSKRLFDRLNGQRHRQKLRDILFGKIEDHVR
jgi:hypothetical protein